MFVDPALDAHMVTGNLLVGAAPDSPALVAQLLAMDVTHVLDCRTIRTTPPPAAVCQGMVWHSAPSEDDGASRGTAWYADCLAFAELALGKDGARLYCHCAAGINRAPAAAYAILRARGWSPTAARVRVLTRRLQAQPRYFEDAETCLRELGVVGREAP